MANLISDVCLRVAVHRTVHADLSLRHNFFPDGRTFSNQQVKPTLVVLETNCSITLLNNPLFQ